MKRSISIMVVLCLFLSGCATAHHLALDERGADRLLLVKEMTTDASGRPVPGKYLKKRPTKVGKEYTAVLMHKGQMLRSFEISVIKPEKADFAKPFEVLGGYTAGGLILGVWIGIEIVLHGDIPDSSDSTGDDAPQTIWDVIAMSAVTGTVIGLTVGFVRSVPVMFEQVNLLALRSNEALLSYTDYEYDNQRRLCLVKSHTNDGRLDHIVSTEFSYEGSNDIPVLSHTSRDVIYVGKASGT